MSLLRTHAFVQSEFQSSRKQITSIKNTTFSKFIGLLILASLFITISSTLIIGPTNGHGIGSRKSPRSKTAELQAEVFEAATDGTGSELSLACGLRQADLAEFYPSSTNGRGRSEIEKTNGSETKNNLLYIVGGDQVYEEQLWPWSVAVYELDPLNQQRGFICSGSLISERFVLTAAHCIQQSRFDVLASDEVYLKVASLRLDDQQAPFYKVSRIFVHPSYSVDRKANDIALLELAADQPLPARARPICLPAFEAHALDFTDEQVTIIGWGTTNVMRGNEPSRVIEGSSTSGHSLAGKVISRDRKSNETTTRQTTGASTTNDTLQQAQVRVTSTDQCDRNYSRLDISWLHIDERFLCANDPLNRRDACQGDSGGPLMWNKGGLKWFQLGLVSFGHGCANESFPGVYTRVAYYVPWILDTLGSRSNRK